MIMASNQSTHRDLEGKFAIVTGGSRGIGAAIGQNLASRGANVVLNYTLESSTERTEALATRLEATHGIKAFAIRSDLSTVTGPASLVVASLGVLKTLSTSKPPIIDIIINNAGISINQSIQDVTPDVFESTYAINVRAPLLLLQAALPWLPQDRSGRIVNVSSVSSSLGYRAQSVYGGSKAALEAMTRSWARELSERATVNSVNPGPVATDMYAATPESFVDGNRPFLQNTPLAVPRRGIDPDKWVDEVEKTGGRPGTEAEVAATVGMLCSAAAAWTTGSVICANGGMIFTC